MALRAGLLNAALPDDGCRVYIYTVSISLDRLWVEHFPAFRGVERKRRVRCYKVSISEIRSHKKRCRALKEGK